MGAPARDHREARDEDDDRKPEAVGRRTLKCNHRRPLTATLSGAGPLKRGLMRLVGCTTLRFLASRPDAACRNADSTPLRSRLPDYLADRKARWAGHPPTI